MQQVYNISGTLVVPAQLVVVLNTLPTPAPGQAYPPTAIATVSGGVSPYSFSLTAGALPPGMTISPAGILSGTPVNQTGVQQSYNYTITITDSGT